MTLTQITKIRGAGIHTTSNIVSHNINSSGIITAVAFKGPFTGSSNIQSGILTATKIDLNGDIDVDGHTNLDNVSIAGVSTFTGDATFSGNVSIGGTLTYEDVTNIDSVGIITARDGLKVLAGGANVVGVVTATSFVGGLPITNGADNRIITASSASAIQGEASLTFDGSVFYIGNSTPKLQMNDGNGRIVELIGGSTSTGPEIRTGYAGDLRIGTNSQERIRVAGVTGYVGINTTGANNAPAAPLHIYGNSNTAPILAFTRSTVHDDWQGGGIGLVDEGGTYKGALTFYTHSSSGTKNDSVTEKLRITSTGLVKIPGDGQNDGFYLSNAYGQAGIFGGMYYNGSSWVRAAAGSRLGAGMYVNTGGHIAFLKAPETSGTSATVTESVRITSDGVVNIGDNTNNTWIDSTLKVRKDQNAVTKIAVRNENQGSSASSAIVVNSYGNSWMFDCGSAAKNSNALTIRVDATASSNQGTEKLRIDTGGRVLLNTETEGHSNADDLTIATAASGSLGNTGITIRSGTSNDGNIFFSDATSGGGETIGGIKYTHGGAGSNAETLNFIANGLTRATVSATAFWVDDGTNARLKLAPDSANLNMIISTTTGNGSYCNLLYGAVDHIFKYGGTETARLSHTGNYTITGEFASAQDYPVIKPTLDLNFAATKTLDSRIEYYRYGPASYIDANGKVVFVGADVPRFDHDPDTGESLGLLIEQEKINYFPNGLRPGDKWTGAKGASVWTENTTETTAPDGSYTATKWEFTGVDPYLYHQGTLNAGVTYTISIWVKAGTNMAGDVLQARMGSGPHSTFANSTIPADGSWKRLTYTKTIGGSNETNVNIGWEPQTNPSGNPASGDVIYVWGAQLESGDHASSLIPTTGTIVTRGADYAAIKGDEFTEWYNDLEGTLFTSHSLHSDVDDNANNYVLEIGDAGSTHVAFRLQDVNNSFSNKPSWGSIYGSGATARFTGTGTFTRGNKVKSIMSGKSSDFAGTFNGETVQTDTSGSFFEPGTTGVMSIGRYGPSAGYELEGHIQRIMYWPKQLTDTQLKTLTS